MLLLEQLRIKIEEETKIASETQCSESLQVPGKLLTETFYFQEKGGSVQQAALQCLSHKLVS